MYFGLGRVPSPDRWAALGSLGDHVHRDLPRGARRALRVTARRGAGERASSGAVLFDPYYVLYYTGFAFIPTERPIAFVVSADGERGDARAAARGGARAGERRHRADRALRRVSGRPARGGRRSPSCSPSMGVAGQIGADQDGYPWILGYQGPTLSELTGAERRARRARSSRSRWR